VESIEQGRAGGDEHSSHYQRADDAVHQYPVLEPGRDREDGEDHGVREDVVD
jgi:hypothetical protein